jgi:hypothetical protein
MALSLQPIPLSLAYAIEPDIGTLDMASFSYVSGLLLAALSASL